MRLGRLECGDVLGTGTFGKVVAAADVVTHERFALKIMEKRLLQQHGMAERASSEVAALQLIRHRNVIGLFEVLATSTHLYLVLELTDGGTLLDHIQESDEGRLDEQTARAFFGQLLNGLACCHQHGVCHRDLKLENLLLDQHGEIKISDFGLAVVTDACGRLPSAAACGSTNYVAPEVWVAADGGYDGFQADIWSCGVILYAMLAGKLPFDALSVPQLLAQIGTGKVHYPSSVPKVARSLLSHLLTTEPLGRCRLPEARAHAWMEASGSVTPRGEPEAIAVSSGGCHASDGRLGPADRPGSWPPISTETAVREMVLMTDWTELLMHES